jgi:hypothetical protein
MTLQEELDRLTTEELERIANIATGILMCREYARMEDMEESYPSCGGF